MGNYERGIGNGCPVTQRIYGGGPMGFHLDLNMPSFTIKKWKQIVADFFRKYTGLASWHIDNLKQVMVSGTMRTITGRKFMFHKTDSGSYSDNQIKNYPVQGVSGGDILPLMVVIIRRGMKKAGMRSKIILTVHDSLVIDYAEDELERLTKLCYAVANNLREYIQSYYRIPWTTKLEGEVEIGPNYSSLSFVPLIG